MRRSLLILALLAVSLPAQASEWYPIDTGRYWVYTGPGGRQYSATIDAPESFAGTSVQPLHWDDGIRELLSEDGAGRVYLHGQNGAPDGSYVVYDPPILRMDSDIAPGHEWEAISNVTEYDADGVAFWSGQEHYTFHVVAIGPVDVPAGTFVAAEVLQTVETTPAVSGVASRASHFYAAPSQVYTFTFYYAEGVGWIRRTDNNVVVFDLLSYGPRPVATEAKTWGGVKALYRD